MVADKSFIVLAGGKGARLRRYKALETIDNESLIQRVVSSLSFFNINTKADFEMARGLAKKFCNPTSYIASPITIGARSKT